jgi:hypothetical protein
MALGLTQPLREKYQKMFLGGKVQPVHKAENLTTISKLII